VSTVSNGVVSATSDCDDRREGTVAELGERNLDIWRIGLERGDDAYRDLLAVLSDPEGDRAARYRFDIDRRRFVIARASLREILGRYLGVGAAEIGFEYGIHGKPALAKPYSDSGIRFNLSHSADIALCALARGSDVGVDVEQIQRDVNAERIAVQFFSPSERRLLAEAHDVSETFARIWVRKEAYVKATGRGLGVELQAFSVSLAEISQIREESIAHATTWTVREVAAPRGYVAAVVTSKPLEITELSQVT
jgi:4'-phosphopantetheinyl transferase